MDRLDLPIHVIVLLTVVLAIVPVTADALERPSPPGQPAEGPGGSVYQFEGTEDKSYGEAAGQYWIIEPQNRTDQALPVVLFVHGMTLSNPNIYDAWIDHLVRKGNVVIFPRYHSGGFVDPKTFTASAASGAVQALAKCDGKRHQKIDTKRFSMIGHSLGGTIVANLAARPEHYKLPTPKALIIMQPGDTKADQGIGALLPSLTEDHGKIPAGTLMLIVDVENDFFVSPMAGQRIYDNAKQVKPADKRRLLLKTDSHGEPALIAGHGLPTGTTNTATSNRAVNTYDFAAWRWFDAMQAIADGDEDQRELVFSDKALDLGKWSDGNPVRRPIDANEDKLEP